MAEINNIEKLAIYFNVSKTDLIEDFEDIKKDNRDNMDNPFLLPDHSKRESQFSFHIAPFFRKTHFLEALKGKNSLAGSVKPLSCYLKF